MSITQIVILIVALIAIVITLFAWAVELLFSRIFESESDREAKRLRERANRELARRQRIKY